MELDTMFLKRTPPSQPRGRTDRPRGHPRPDLEPQRRPVDDLAGGPLQGRPPQDPGADRQPGRPGPAPSTC
ncbi:MAG: hypothetical protein MZU79_05185 [Anaerotruncus sp.]|nr:hypothetical protein [Anaerotruncus sp.]